MQRPALSLPKPESSAVESSVAEIVQSVRLSGDVPGFVIQMIEEQWRMVLLLIGLNKGVSSLAWQEAEHVLHILVACTAGKAQVTPFDESLLLDKISQGLRLLRMSATDAEQFVSSLKEYFPQDCLGQNLIAMMSRSNSLFLLSLRQR